MYQTYESQRHRGDCQPCVEAAGIDTWGVNGLELDRLDPPSLLAEPPDSLSFSIVFFSVEGRTVALGDTLPLLGGSELSSAGRISKKMNEMM